MRKILITGISDLSRRGPLAGTFVRTWPHNAVAAIHPPSDDAVEPGQSHLTSIEAANFVMTGLDPIIHGVQPDLAQLVTHGQCWLSWLRPHRRHRVDDRVKPGHYSVLRARAECDFPPLKERPQVAARVEIKRARYNAPERVWVRSTDWTPNTAASWPERT